MQLGVSISNTSARRLARMRKHLPSLNQLKAFEATARHLSFSEAAQELHVTHAAVSHQVKALENFLQSRLFVRMTRSIKLTGQGEALFLETRKALDIIEAAATGFFENRLCGVLKISVAPSFANRWLLPRLVLFRAMYPTLNVEVLPAIELSKLSESDVDLTIRHGSGSWPGLTSVGLFDEILVPVASPDFLASMAKKNFWQEALLGASPRSDEWSDWLGSYTGKPAPVLSIMLYPTQALALDAAVGGGGIALADRRLVENDIKGGRLVVIQDTAIPSKNGYFLCYPSGPLTEAKIVAFRDWITAQLS